MDSERWWSNGFSQRPLTERGQERPPPWWLLLILLIALLIALASS
jgi:hypothetical protein